MVQRKAINDTRGHVSELLAKCIPHGALDAEISKEDRERMTTFLKIYGQLDAKGAYVGSGRAGYSTPPGAGKIIRDQDWSGFAGPLGGEAARVCTTRPSLRSASAPHPITARTGGS